MSGKNFGEGGSGGVGSGGSDTEPKAETDPDVDPAKGLRVASAADGSPGENIDYGGGPAAPRKAKKRSKDRRKPRRVPGNGGGRDSAKEMFGQLLFAPSGNSLTLEDFVAPSTVELRRVFPTIVCEKMFGEELGPGNEPCEGWNQPVVLETPSLEPPVGNKCNSHEWEELIPEFLADFTRVHKLDGGRMELAREATAVRASGEAKAIHALIAWKGAVRAPAFLDVSEPQGLQTYCRGVSLS
jgi:hypothetical protein